MLDRPFGFPVGDLRVGLIVEPQRGRAFRVLHDLIPHVRLVSYPERAIVRADENGGLHRPGRRDVGGLFRQKAASAQRVSHTNGGGLRRSGGGGLPAPR